RLIDSMPVVETLLRVGGGDVIHRVAAARAGSSVGDALEAVVVEITNGTADPIAVALAARPFGLSASAQHLGGDGFNNGGRITALELDAQTLNVSSGWERTVLFDRLPGDVVQRRRRHRLCRQAHRRSRGVNERANGRRERQHSRRSRRGAGR
ncbi:hypothetical protein, partial [Candidatus Poriferisodalis sp.]|uniref:hypothetical protein n=1 Tax=Candidatus Poriferisodalis sp. TaxID=3101277 RepID=UPI003B519A81